MGLKGELMVTNDPTDESESGDVADETKIEIAEEANASSDKSQSDTSSNESVETEATAETTEPDVETEAAAETTEPDVEIETQEEETTEEESDPEEEEEEEVVDPMEKLKETCSERSEAKQLKAVWDECTERVSGKSNTTETCTQEIFDFLHNVDHCVSKSIFKHLK